MGGDDTRDQIDYRYPVIDTGTCWQATRAGGLPSAGLARMITETIVIGDSGHLDSTNQRKRPTSSVGPSFLRPTPRSHVGHLVTVTRCQEIHFLL